MQQRGDKHKQPHPNASVTQQFRYSNNGSEGGGVGGYISRISSGPTQAAQQDPKSQPQQSLAGPMPMGYANARGPAQFYQPQRAQTQRLNQNSAPRMTTMQGVYALPSPFPQQVPPGTQVLLPYMTTRQHQHASAQAQGNQQNYYQPAPLPTFMPAPQTMAPPYSNYQMYMSAAQMRPQFTQQNSTPNPQLNPQPQPAPQQSAVPPLYMDQGASQVAMSSLGGGPNGTPHMMSSQAPTSIAHVQNSGPQSVMMTNPQASKEYKKKERRFAIPIIHPTSGQNVLAEMRKEEDGVSHSADSSASHSPQPQSGKETDDIKAKQVVGEFASKVAAAAFVGPPTQVPSAPQPSTALHDQDRLNGPLDPPHENEIVKEPSPIPPSHVTFQLSAPQQLQQQQQAPPPQQPPAPQQQPPPQQPPAPHPPPFVPTVSAITNSPPIELHRPSPPSVSAVVKQLPPGSSGPPLASLQTQQAPPPVPTPVVLVPAHSSTPAPVVAATAPPPSLSPQPVASPVPVAPTQPAPPQTPQAPQVPVSARKTQVMGPPSENAVPLSKKGDKKKESREATAAVERGGSGGGLPAPPPGRSAGRPGPASTPPPAATTTVVGPPPVPAELSARSHPAPEVPSVASKPRNNFSEMTDFKKFAPSSTTNATRVQAPVPAPTPAPAPVEEKGTNGETDAPVGGKATQRPKKKPNLTRKGVDKTGTEMDAFVEPTPAPAPPTPAAREPSLVVKDPTPVVKDPTPVVRDPTPTPPPKETTPAPAPAPAPETKTSRPVESSPAPVIKFIQPDELEAEDGSSVVEDDEYLGGTDMDAMVAAKNEENAKVSAAAAAAAANNNNNITSSVTVSKKDEEEEEEVDGENQVEGDGEVEENEDEAQNIKSMTIERSPPATQALKYSYKDDQWSPVNTDGKKVYDRDFLLEIKNSALALKKPEFNLDLDIFRDKPNDSAPSNARRMVHSSNSMSSRGDNIGPQYMRSSSSSNQRPQIMKMGGRDRGPPGRGMGGLSNSQSGMRGMGVGKGYSSMNSYVSREPEPQLHKDPNGWKPERLKGGTNELTEEQKQIEKLKKTVRGILNKLTPQKFEKLTKQILALPIDTETHLEEMVNLVFEKAVDEPSFSKAYADLCARLQKQVIQGKDNAQNEGTVAVGVSFRKLLLNKCQEGFEKNDRDGLTIAIREKEIEETADVEKKKELKLLLDEDERKIRRKSVGLVRFIGELYKLRMLTHGIMHECLKNLLNQVAEEPLECLCKLLSTVGKELEAESNKKTFDEYFAVMGKLAQKSPESKVSSRIRFMLQDVIELRQKNWKPRRDENNPKTIEQIQKDAERDALMESAMLNAPINMAPKGRHPNDGRRNLRPSQDNDGWQSAGGNKYRTGSSSYTNTVEASKLQHFKQTQSDAGDAGISLGGQGTFSQWGSGASSKRLGGSGGMDSSRSGPTNFTANKFAALTQAEERMSKSYSSSMGGKGKVSGSSSLEKERGVGMMRGDRDKEDMRRMGSGPSSRENSRPRYAQPGHSPASSLNSRMERDYSRSSEHSSSRGGGGYPSLDNREAVESRVPPQQAPDLDEDDAQRKAVTVFEEWCGNNNVQETFRTINETFIGQRNGCLLIRIILNKVIEGKPHARLKFAELVLILLDKKYLSPKDVITELQAMIELGDEMVVDIPFFWTFMGQILAPLLASEVFTFDELKAVMQDRPLEDRAKVLSEVFKNLVQNEKTSVWSTSNTKLSDFVPENEIDTFVKSNNFSFLSSSNDELPTDVRKYMDTLVSILQAENDKAFDEACAYLAKIESSVSKKVFIEIVTKAVITASVKDGKLVPRLITKNDKLIHKFVDNSEELELICLFAIKNLVVIEGAYELQVLTESFRYLYDDFIISIEAFKKWKDDTSVEPEGSTGRLLAYKVLEPFYVFLAEADDEDEES